MTAAYLELFPDAPGAGLGRRRDPQVLGEAAQDKWSTVMRDIPEEIFRQVLRRAGNRCEGVIDDPRMKRSRYRGDALQGPGPAHHQRPR